MQATRIMANLRVADVEATKSFYTDYLGLAAAAHSKLLERLAEAGVTTARLRVFEQNHRARRFYEKPGWRPTDRVSRTSFPPHPVLMEYKFDL